MVRINVYLIKNGFINTFPYILSHSKVTSVKNCILDDDVYLRGEDSIKAHILRLKKKPKEILKANCNYELYFRNNPSYEPDWKEFWGISDSIKQQTADAITFLKIGTRIFAICHGHTTHLLNPYAIEPFFGIRTAINMLDPSTINSADVFTPSELSFQTRKKTGVGADFKDFEINTLNTLLKNIAGKVKKEYETLFKHIDGSDSFKFNFSSTPNILINTLDELLSIYELNNYKKTIFKYLDNFTPVKDKSIVDEFDNELIKSINERNLDVFITTPVDLNYTGAFNFKFTGFGGRSNNVFDNFNISTTFYSLLDQSQKIINYLDELKKLRLRIVDYDNVEKEINNFSLYKCLYYEIRKDKKWYFIESGIWYEVDNDFSNKIDTEISPMLDNYLEFDIVYDKNELRKKFTKPGEKKYRYEKWFNLELEKLLKETGRSVCLDANNIQMLGYDKIEVCDVLYHNNSGERLLFHNKYKYGSSALSHLFSQGNVSAELLTNKDFRCKVNTKIEDSELQFSENDEYDSRDYTIVYGIITKKNRNGIYSIPLFSKINLKIFVDSLKSKSYKVRVCFFDEK